MKTKQLILSACLFMPFFLTAQVNKTFLKDYKYPDLKRQTLDVGTGFFAGARQAVETTGNNPSDKFNNNHFSFSGSSVYTLFINNRKWQNTIRARIEGDFDRVKTKEPLTADLTERSMDFDLNFSSNNRRYNTKEFFLEFNVNGDVNMKWDKSEGETNATTLDNEKNETVNIELGVGKGRLEYISDATMALYTLRDFEALGILEKEMTNEDVKAFADLIAEVRNERFFDGRLKIIYQLTQLDSLLQERGIIDEGDAASFTTLYDNWFYGFRDFRYSGSRFSFGLRGFGRFSQTTKVDLLTSSENRSQHLVPGVYANYQLEIPVNLFLQHGIYIDALGGLEENKSNQFGNISNQYFINGELRYRFAYYPNTRTSVSASVNFRAIYKDGEEQIRSTNFAEQLRMETYYYISPRARLSAFVNFQFLQNEYERSDTFNYYYNNEAFNFTSGINFSYAIF